MRVIFTTTMVLSCVLVLATAGASPLLTKWSSPASITQVVAAGSKVIYCAGGQNELQAFDAATGVKKWSRPSPAGLGQYTVDSIKVVDAADRVLVMYLPGNPASSQRKALYSFSSVDGSVVWSVTLAESTSTAQTESLVLASGPSYNFAANNVVGYDLVTGSIKFNISINTAANGLWAQGDIAVVQGGTFSHAGFVSENYQIDLETGKMLCTVKSDATLVGDSASGPLVGELVLGQVNSNPSFLYDAKTCKTVHTFSSQHSFAVLNNRLYSGGVTELTSYDKDGKRWSTAINSGEYGFYTALSTLPFQPDAVVTNAKGIFSAVNATTGAVLWNTSQVLPFGPRSSVNQQVYPLGAKTLFVPNLQGYAVLHNNNVVGLNEHTAIRGTFSFMDSTTQTPFVVYGDLTNGNLVAVELSA